MRKKLPIVGHRGLSATYPENTLIAFEKALECGVDAMELDVQLTADHQLVVTHDPEIKRCSNGEGLIREMTFAELRALDFGLWKGEEFRGTRIPTLVEVLDLVFGKPRPGFQLQIEIKDDQEECAEQVVNLLQSRRLLDQCMIISFYGHILQKVHELEPRLLLEGFPEEGMATHAENMYDFIDYVCIWNAKLTTENVKFFHDRGIKVNTYRGDSRQDVENALRFDVDSITSNNPDQIIPILRELGLI